jgi:hypothetical protein
MKKRLFIIVIFAVSMQIAAARDVSQQYKHLYDELNLQNKLSYEVFEISLKGFHKIKEKFSIDKSIITIIDYSKPSTEKRFFLIDLLNKKILYSSLVAHGRNSGGNVAHVFSNRSGSLQSSLGFYITSHTYYGKHGYSLRLKGLEKGINDKAEQRTIVIHKADYVSNNFIKKYGRLGRSWGCPALPNSISKQIIDLIKDGTCLFIYGKNKNYLKRSSFLY